MKVLVTGGAGFIGSNLCEYLLAHNYEVVCLDNFATGKIENLLPLLNQYPDTFKLIVGDIRNFSDCQKAVVGVNYILHEAALGSVPRSIKDPATTNAVNISGFLNMLIAARDADYVNDPEYGPVIAEYLGTASDYNYCTQIGRAHV